MLQQVQIHTIKEVGDKILLSHNPADQHRQLQVLDILDFQIVVAVLVILDLDGVLSEIITTEVLGAAPIAAVASAELPAAV